MSPHTLDEHTKTDQGRETNTPTAWSVFRKRLSVGFLMHWLYDLIQVVGSVVDVVLDILVAIEFKSQGRDRLFWTSISIFVLAQFTYALLFTMTWARNKRTIRGRMLVFFAVLPFSQFVPLFSWVENFHFRWLDDLLEDLTLAPTEAIHNENSVSVLSFITGNKHAHAGFLAEAIVEAIPQSILQLSAILVVTDGGATPVTTLNLTSILLSTFVIASKGYFISFSVYTMSFVANCLCVASDVVGLFAFATWVIYSVGNRYVLHEQVEEGWADAAGLSAFEIYENCTVLVLTITVGLFVAGGFCVLWFANVDDQIKFLDRITYNNTMLFDMYVSRVLAWVLAVLPLSVLVVGTQMTLVASKVLNTLDVDQAIHQAFFKGIHRFVRYGRTNSDKLHRISVVETFFRKAQCLNAQRHLRLAMIAAIAKRQEGGEPFKQWLNKIDEMYELNFVRTKTPQQELTVEEEPEGFAIQHNIDSFEFNSMLVAANTKKSWAYRLGSLVCRLSGQTVLTRAYNSFFNRIRQRSVVLPLVHPQDPQESSTFIERLRDVPRSHAVLYVLGIFLWYAGVLFWALCVPFYVLFHLLACTFPFVQLAYHTSRVGFTLDGPVVIPVMFTICYAVAMASTLGTVIAARIQTNTHENSILQSPALRGLQPVIYDNYRLIVQEIHHRYTEECDWRVISKFLQRRLNRDIVSDVAKFVETRRKPEILQDPHSTEELIAQYLARKQAKMSAIANEEPASDTA